MQAQKSGTFRCPKPEYLEQALADAKLMSYHDWAFEIQDIEFGFHQMVRSIRDVGIDYQYASQSEYYLGELAKLQRLFKEFDLLRLKQKAAENSESEKQSSGGINLDDPSLLGGENEENDWRVEHRRNELRKTVVNRAIELFQEKSYGDVVDLLTPYESTLSKTELAKLMFARKRINPEAGRRPAASALESEVAQLGNRGLDSTAEISRLIESGTLVTFSLFGENEDHFRARLKVYSAYAKSNEGFSVVGAKCNKDRRLMIVLCGSAEARFAFLEACKSRGEIDRLNGDLLTAEEIQLLRPTVSYSNFPHPGCELTSMDTFNEIYSQLVDGEYELFSG